MTAPRPLSVLLQAFFTEHLMKERRASAYTIASYRDSFRLLLTFARKRLHKMPAQLVLDDLGAPFVSAFLDHIQGARHCGVRTRNLRLTAIRSFFHYIAFQEPRYAALIDRVLAMPTKRYDRALIDFLTPPEIQALLAAPDTTSGAGRRDRALLLLAIQTGLRLSELIGLRRRDVVLTSGAHVRCFGKGRKERCTPLTKQTVAVLKPWLQERGGSEEEVVFPNARGGSLSPDGVQYLLAKHVATAAKGCPSLAEKHVSPHVLRHTAAMELLQAGVDHAVIALWLGHESAETTNIYLQASMVLKEKALAKTKPASVRPGRYKPQDGLMQFLTNL
jgi:site-specific recombinase XerD